MHKIQAYESRSGDADDEHISDDLHGTESGAAWESGGEIAPATAAHSLSPPPSTSSAAALAVDAGSPPPAKNFSACDIQNGAHGGAQIDSMNWT